MSLRSLLKKAGMTLGSLLLTCNIGCKSLTYPQSAVDVKSTHTDLEDEADSEKPRRLKLWQYPVNIVGGYFTHIFAHEGGHALAAMAQGVGVEEFHPYPGVINGDFYGGWVSYEPESYLDSTPNERALMSIAGPAGDIALAEIIGYNLRNGKIPKKYQPFWATTSLMARGGLFFYAIKSLKDRDGALDDFSHLEMHTGIPKETWIGLVGLYTASSAKEIAKNFKVALGRDFYDTKGKGKKGYFSMIPFKNELYVSYTLNF